jgi:AraC-like DNA-binding protein
MYREHAISPSLRGVAICTWHHVTERPMVTRVVPDACTDIMWDGSSLTVAGPDTIPMPHALAAGDHMVAIRFAPGCGPRLFGAPGTALRNSRVDFVELWGDDAEALCEQLARANDVTAQRQILERTVQQRMAAETLDRLVLETVRRLNDFTQAVPSVAKLAAELGVTERQLLRRSNVALGYGPKQLARILRFQGFMRELRRAPATTLAELAFLCGYSDQAHLTHETSELAGATPGQLQLELLQPGVPPAGVLSSA